MEICVRYLALTIAILFGIPAVAVPLLAAIAAMSAPAALIAGIAAVAIPAHDGREAMMAANTMGRRSGKIDEVPVEPTGQRPRNR